MIKISNVYSIGLQWNQDPKIVEQVFSFYILNILDFSEMSRPKPKPTMVKKRRKKAGEKVGKKKKNVKFKFWP